MAKVQRHIFLVLTKRIERAQQWVNNFGVTLPNVWIGTSVENQYWANVRIPVLLETFAVVRFVSVEPLLKQVDLGGWMSKKSGIDPEQAPDPKEARRIMSLAGVALLDWVVVGGESGPRARPVELDWVRAIRDQCEEAKVPFFFKQMGGPRPGGEALLGGVQHHNWPAVVNIEQRVINRLSTDFNR